jgi:hypothetical protein
MNKLVIVLPAIIGLAALYGYIMNITILFSGGGEGDITMMSLARLLGIVAVPLGAILGYF